MMSFFMKVEVMRRPQWEAFSTLAQTMVLRMGKALRDSPDVRQ
jgi:hypothetical protein